MPTVWTVEPEPSFHLYKQTGPGNHGPVVVRRRLFGDNHLQGDPSVRQGVSSKPDGGVITKPELVDDSVSTIVHITKMHGVEASLLITFEVFTFFQIGWPVFHTAVRRIRLGFHGGVERFTLMRWHFVKRGRKGVSSR